MPAHQAVLGDRQRYFRKAGRKLGEIHCYNPVKRATEGIPRHYRFPERNLWFMTQFYNEYHDVEFLQPLVAEKEYFIDLLLYHRELRCLVAVELKIGVLTYTTTAKLPKNYKNLLPDNKAISQKLDLLF